jgi:thiamine-phosphate pyrophosphorylase
MASRLPNPLLYLITSGQLTAQTTPATEDFANCLRLVQAAATGGIDLVQIREKNLPTRVLYELALKAVRLTTGTETHLLINDRADVAAAAGAAGVHLTTTSLPAEVVRAAFGADFLIGVSTHSSEEAAIARQQGADFVVFGPVFPTASKSEYGAPQGLAKLRHVCAALAPFPVLALGGITHTNVTDCLAAGAHGVAAIGMFADPLRLRDTVSKIRETF